MFRQRRVTMADKDYEFECPQFVDFSSGLEGPSNQELVFDFPVKNGFSAKFKFTEKRGFLKVLRSTPMNKPCNQTNNTDSDKINTRTKNVFKRLSRSVDYISKQPVKKEIGFFPLVCRKRSISASGGRPKKITRAITPECLKRSLKNFKKYKTTEELELEKIAELRKQTSENLRANERAMKKLKLKQASFLDRTLGCAPVNSGAKGAEDKRLQNGTDSFLRNIFQRRIMDFQNQRNVKETQANTAGPNKALSGGNGIWKSTGMINAQRGGGLKPPEIFLRVPTMEFIRRPPKSRRCLFQ